MGSAPRNLAADAHHCILGSVFEPNVVTATHLPYQASTLKRTPAPVLRIIVNLRTTGAAVLHSSRSCPNRYDNGKVAPACWGTSNQLRRWDGAGLIEHGSSRCGLIVSPPRNLSPCSE